jgi:hypothetical protein
VLIHFAVGRSKSGGFWPNSAHLASPLDPKIDQFFFKECIDTMNVVEDSLFCLYKKIESGDRWLQPKKGKKWATS